MTVKKYKVIFQVIVDVEIEPTNKKDFDEMIARKKAFDELDSSFSGEVPFTINTIEVKGVK
jgi:hypothetical protein